MTCSLPLGRRFDLRPCNCCTKKKFEILHFQPFETHLISKFYDLIIDILFFSYLRYLNDEGYCGGFERPQVDDIFKQVNKNFTKWVKQFAPFAVKMNDYKAIAEFESSLGRMKPKIALSVAKMVFLSDLRKVLPKVRTRTTIILTRTDNIVPKSVAFYIKSKMGSHSNVRILNSEGHFPQLTAYPQLLKVMSKVLHLKHKI